MDYNIKYTFLILILVIQSCSNVKIKKRSEGVEKENSNTEVDLYEVVGSCNYNNNLLAYSIYTRLGFDSIARTIIDEERAFSNLNIERLYLFYNERSKTPSDHMLANNKILSKSFIGGIELLNNNAYTWYLDKSTNEIKKKQGIPSGGASLELGKMLDSLSQFNKEKGVPPQK